jgi:hypothetical protein
MRPAQVVMRDPTLPHQIVVGVQWQLGGTRLYVSCNCKRIAGEAYEPLDVRDLYEPGDALAVWRAHMTEVAA